MCPKLHNKRVLLKDGWTWEGNQNHGWQMELNLVKSILSPNLWILGILSLKFNLQSLLVISWLVCKSRFNLLIVVILRVSWTCISIIIICIKFRCYEVKEVCGATSEFEHDACDHYHSPLM